MLEQTSNIHLRFHDGDTLDKIARRVHSFIYQGKEYDQSNQINRARCVRLAIKYLNCSMTQHQRKVCGL